MKSYLKLLLVFSMPLMLSLFKGDNTWFNTILLISAASSLAFLFYAVNQNTLGAKLFRYALLFTYFCLLFFVVFESLLYDFTGAGYTEEVYYHLSWQSFKVGFSEYTWQLTALFLFMLGFLFTAEFFIPTNHRKTSSLGITFMVLACYMATLFYSSAGNFLTRYYQYYNQNFKVESIDLKLLEPFIQAGFINPTNIVKKNQLRAKTEEKKNLIFIYLESFNQFLIDNPGFNSLTPNLNHLGDEFRHFTHQNSAYVTIEGLVSSQCGTLLTMSSGNDSFMKKSDAMSELPCLGDILAVAGYKQYFLGGAKMEFAGKGDFLTTHGYNHVWGMEHWRSLGKNTKKNIWGLSDTELFEEAYKIIKEAAKDDPPYNMTLLTLGTHIPGFVYSGCESINNDNQFLAAVACTDLLVGQFIKKLRKADLLDSTLVVIVADHGVFPNPKMKELFGQKVYDRRLVGITNHHLESSSEAISTYDLAPTILDWLDVSHNAGFLFGQTLHAHTERKHKHISRYTDWLNGEAINNSKGECRDDLHQVETLNTCEKKLIKSITQQVLEQFSVNQKIMSLACQNSIQVNLTKTDKTLLINQVNQYDKFHYNGYNLTTRQYIDGHFILEVDAELNVINTKYYKTSKAETDHAIFIPSEKTTNTVYAIEVLVSADTNSAPAKMWLYQGETVKELAPIDGVFRLGLCENQSF